MGKGCSVRRKRGNCSREEKVALGPARRFEQQNGCHGKLKDSQPLAVLGGFSAMFWVIVMILSPALFLVYYIIFVCFTDGFTFCSITL